ncbi:hypothetical protein BH11VER1_BH11VER1_24800 [soil metagenome]
MNRSLTLLALFVLSLGAFASEAKPDTLSAAKQIDAILSTDWQKNKLKPNDMAPDEVFVRRIYLDIAGRIPTQREAETFMADKGGDKRSKLIDQLLAGEGYVQHMFNYWADILRLQTNGNAGAITGTAYAKFLKESLRSNKPYDQLVRELVGSHGEAWDNGAIGYYMRDRGMPLDNMAATVRVFLGTRIECAQCHNHPFDKWSQKQFYEMAAFTYGIETNDYYGSTQMGVRDLMRDNEKALRDKFKQPELKKTMTPEERATAKTAGEEMGKQARLASEALRKEQRFLSEALNDVRNVLRYTTVSLNSKKELRLPHDYQYPDMKPKAVITPLTMMGQSVNCPPDANSVQVYAQWMTSSENPRFTNVVANRLWKKAFGMGLIEPVDELLDTTVAMNPDLMKYLEKLMVSMNYDMKGYLRVLYNTQAYQRSVTKEEIPAGVDYHFTGPLLRRMSAEQMWDSFVALINPTPDMPNLATIEQGEKRLAGARKISDALDTLTPEEMFKGAEIAGGKYRESAQKVQELQKQIAEAREIDDKEKVKALSRELNGCQQIARKAVNDNIFVPAVKKLLVSKTGATATPAASPESGSPVVAQADSNMMMSGSSNDMNYDRIKVPGYDQREKTKEEEKTEQEAHNKVFLDEANYYGIPEKNQKDYVRARQSIGRNWLRSAEIDSPAPRGHYLREFGQSDRETIENANYDASVPQVLALMNSGLLPQIMDRYSQLMLNVNKAAYPDDKVESIYMTLLSRKPTALEKEKWVKAQANGLVEIEDLIYALINTQQFVFIQ